MTVQSAGPEAGAETFVVPFALAGADPVLTLLTWGGGVSVLALMLLYLLTSVSVIVFFRRTRLDERIWHTRLAPLLAVALLCGATVLALRNFTTLVSASATTALVLELTVVAVFAGECSSAACGPGPVHMTKARNHDR
ncbi:hypothetical protein [Streptomyces sp. BH105]|uniref:hypothetical protein n=1 Tax=Streptomyces sp. BH105 TaxID=3410408 RepID=UPI003CF511A5